VWISIILVRKSDHEATACQDPTLHLPGACIQVHELASKTLIFGTAGRIILCDGAGAAAAIATPEVAPGDERHRFGQIAVHAALELLGLDGRVDGIGVSVSHTCALSLAVAVKLGGPRIGVDVERTHPERPRLARRVLTPVEIEEVGHAPSWLEVLRRFCAKEAAYKALTAKDQVNLTFRTLEIERPDREGVCRVRRVLDGAAIATVVIVSGSGLTVALAEHGE
jgi:phosphopantetheinyl transferase (holo-ACP synthase)